MLDSLELILPYLIRPLLRRCFDLQRLYICKRLVQEFVLLFLHLKRAEDLGQLLLFAMFGISVQEGVLCCLVLGVILAVFLAVPVYQAYDLLEAPVGVLVQQVLKLLVVFLQGAGF